MEVREPVRRYTYKDYASWPDDVRVELIDGIAYDMAPAPHYNHQLLQGYLYIELGNFLKGKPCVPMHAPTDVLFEDSEDTGNVVQPDVFVICDESSFTDRSGAVIGVPTFIAEILSPSSMDRDLLDKRELYAKYGVSEYWILSPMSRYIQQLTLIDGAYTVTKHVEGIIESTALPGFRVDLAELFGWMR